VHLPCAPKGSEVSNIRGEMLVQLFLPSTDVCIILKAPLRTLYLDPGVYNKSNAPVCTLYLEPNACNKSNALVRTLYLGALCIF
jgi:hypothetical protein